MGSRSLLRAAIMGGVVALGTGGGVVALLLLSRDGSRSNEDVTSGVPKLTQTATEPEPIKRPAGMVHGGGGSPPEYVEAVPLVPGDYKPPSASTEAHLKFTRALGAAGAEAQFNGIVNGFGLYGSADAAADPSLLQKECVSGEFPEVKVMEFTYLPPGTKARSPQYGGVCADGSTAWVTQDFVYGYGTFSVGYELGEKAIGHDATAERVGSGYRSWSPGRSHPTSHRGREWAIHCRLYLGQRLHRGWCAQFAINGDAEDSRGNPMRRLLAYLTIAALAVVGAVWQSSANANHSIYPVTAYLYHPTGFANDAELRCGWHDVCDGYFGDPTKKGLDWGFPGNSSYSVWVRMKIFGGQASEWVGRVQSVDSTSGCYRIWSEIYFNRDYFAS